MATADETQLFARLSDPCQRREAFADVVRTYGESLYWKIRHIVLVHEDADDVLQNVFVKAWRSIDDFHGNSRLSTWLYRIAINESLDFIRRNKRDMVMGMSSDESVANRLVGDEYFDGDRAEVLLQEAIASLPEVQKVVFSLRYYDDMKYSEISSMLGTSEGALKASYHLAVKKISAYLDNND